MTRPARALGLLLLLAGLAAVLELASWVGWRAIEGSFFTWERAFALRAELAATLPAEPAEPEPEEPEGNGGSEENGAGAADGAGLEWLAGHLAGQVIHPFIGFVYSPEYNLAENRNLRNLRVADSGFFVLRDESPPPSERPLRVGVFGGSVAMVFSFQGRRVLVPALAPLAGPRGVVLESYAHGGYKQPQQLMTLAWLLARGEAPDLVINLDGFNEITLPRVENLEGGVNPFYPRAWEYRVQGAADPGFRRLLGEASYLERRRAELAVRFNRRVLQRSVTWNLLWRWLDRRRAGAAGRVHERLLAYGTGSGLYVAHGPAYEAANKEQVIADLVAMWERSSLAMHDLATGAGVAYYHFLQPNQYVPDSKPLTPEERRIAYNRDQVYRAPARQGYPVLRAAGARLAARGVEFHDLTGLFAEERRTLYLDDCCHLNPLGNDLVAAAIAEAILADLAGGGLQPGSVEQAAAAMKSGRGGLRAP
jgi:hypothetical protein